MQPLVTVRTWVKEVALWCNGLAGSSLDTPIIGNWAYVGLNTIYAELMQIYIALQDANTWADNLYNTVVTKLDWYSAYTSMISVFPVLADPWATIRTIVRGTWGWLDDIWGSVAGIVRAIWPWLDDPGGTIKSVVKWWWPFLDDMGQVVRGWGEMIWPWLNTIDDKIVDTVTARWNYLNTIDDKIRMVAWDYVLSKLGDWLLDWLLLNLTVWGKIGYRILDRIWNMEWDDANKEAK